VTRLLAALALGSALALTGCTGSGDDGALASNDGGAAASAAPGAPASPTACTSQAPVAQAAAGTTDLTKKPQIEIPDGPPPCNLVISDIVKGTGAEAVSGQQITVKYVGVTYPDGNEFDASWGREDFTFQLGAGMVIGGWDQGFTGMKVGGRRQLVIPPELGYGPEGSGPIPPNATLIFVVDLVKVG
jgi:peptidylprolyl isomerase